MDAQLVWNTWRRILTSDQLVDAVLRGPDQIGSHVRHGLTTDELAILADYAATPTATDTNIAMYRQGLVRNALAALALVPLSRQLLDLSGLDPETVAADLVKSTGYADRGPNHWLVAGDFVSHLANLPEFSSDAKQDLLALDSAAVALARRLGVTSVAVWPDTAAANFSPADRAIERDSRRLVACRAAIAVTCRCDLTPWLEEPDGFDADQDLEPSATHWVIYFPTADSTQAYAKLTDHAARAFAVLSIPRTIVEVSQALDVPAGEVRDVIDSLAELGVVVDSSQV